MNTSEVFEGLALGDEPPSGDADGGGLHLVARRPSGGRQDILLSGDAVSSHILFLGGTGTGKTNVLCQLVAQMRRAMGDDDVAVIFDTKGDYRAEFFRHGDVVFGNGASAIGPSGQDFWNIFGEIRESGAGESSINEIAKTLFKERTERTAQPFFPNAAKDIFAAILTHFVRKEDPHEATNEGLRDFLDRATAADMRTLLQAHADLRAICSYIGDDRAPQTIGVLSELQQLTRDVFVDNFRRRGSLSIRQLIRRKEARFIFIEYDLGLGEVLTPIYQLLMDLAIKESLCRNSGHGRVWYVIDEFRLLPRLQHIADGLNFGRGLGARFIVSAQSVAQLFEGYGESGARSILSGFMSLVAFRVNDPASREYVQQRFGRNRKKEVYASSVRSRGIVESVRDGYVVEDWDMSALAIGQAIVGLLDSPPFRVEFEEYRRAAGAVPRLDEEQL